MQQNFTDIEYSCRKKETRRDKFLNKMDKMVPWADWIAMIEPFYPSGRRGRPTRGIEIILRMYMLQNWFNLADEALEDAVYDSYSFRSFLHLDFFDEQVPDATTLLKFRRFLEKNKIGEKIFADVKERLEKAGLMMHGGPDEEGQPVVLRHENPFRSRRRQRIYPHHYINRRQRP